MYGTALLTWTVQQCLLVSLPVNDLLNLCPDGNHSVTEPVQLSLQKAARSKQSGSKCSLQGKAWRLYMANNQEAAEAACNIQLQQ